MESESKIQQNIVRWYRNNFCLAHHVPRSMIVSIPNEGRGMAASKLIQTGLYPGCADIMIIHSVRNYGTVFLFVEVKTPSGVQSDKQKLFESHCQQMGIRYYVIRSEKEFENIILDVEHLKANY